jgi:5-methyltetrahydrofolate--homocysteine methyltransferase
VEILEALKQAVVDGDAPETQRLVGEALAAGLPPARILQYGLILAMTDVGMRYEAGEFFVPEMLMAARAMKTGLALLRPGLAAANVKPLGKIVIGTVQGDLHDIGKNLVGIMLEGAGFEVVDVGVDVAPQGFVEAVRTHQPDLVGISALLTTTMPKMKATVDALNAAGLRASVKIMAGGAPVTEQYAREIGADIYAPDAAAAANRAKAAMR